MQVLRRRNQLQRMCDRVGGISQGKNSSVDSVEEKGNVSDALGFSVMNDANQGSVVNGAA